jgi:hypothetical protein
MMNHMLRGGRPERPENSVEVGLTDDLWELARSCWEKDANKRPKIQTVLEQLKKIRDKGPEVSSVEPSSGALSGGNSPPSSISKSLQSTKDPMSNIVQLTPIDLIWFLYLVRGKVPNLLLLVEAKGFCLQ